MAYSFLDLAHDVLQSAYVPMTYQQCWSKGIELGLTSNVKTKGKTPWQSLGAQLYVDVRDNPTSRFIKVTTRPARFFLKARAAELTDDMLLKEAAIEEPKISTPKTTYHERDLHPLLTYYASANPTFSRGRSIYTKTIFHEHSSRGGYNKWIHPDLVGVYFPLDDWEQVVINFNQLLDSNSIRLFSFEMKISLTKSNYREAFFQAVSNSSWAHEGYLVAAEITQDDDLLAELGRLSASFGIGIIHLHLSDFSSSEVLFPARAREVLDWETINKLCEQNKDFAKFIQDVKIDFESERIHPSEYDAVLPDPEKHIKIELKIEQDT